MQRDDHLPLDEIYSTPEALHEDVEKIIDLALYEVSENTPLRLRFITPVSFDEWLEDDNYNDYRLTTPEEHEDILKYATVSYCWKHTQSSIGLPPMPQYRISKPSKDLPGGFKLISCPELVFHRAMMFARSRKCPFVWIDQECIDQTDPSDIQEHLKVMHRVYAESMWTVAPLSYTITNNHLLERLITYIYHRRDEDGNRYFSSADFPREKDHIISSFDECVQGTTELLGLIMQDAWFTRTWAFQEKRCASELFLLVPNEVPSQTSARVRPYMIGTDLCFDMIQYNDVSSLHVHDTYQILQFSGGSHDSLSYLHRLQSYYATSWDYVASGNWGLYSILRSIQDCENLVVADRIAILGHACQFRYRVVSNILNHDEYSFSACVIALIVGNINFTRADSLVLLKETWEKFQRRQAGTSDVAMWLLILLDSAYLADIEVITQFHPESVASQPGRTNSPSTLTSSNDHETSQSMQPRSIRQGSRPDSATSHIFSATRSPAILLYPTRNRAAHPRRHEARRPRRHSL